jgi:AmmeMemoRadiSam system protein B
VEGETARALHTGIIDADEVAHKYEHSIEVQLPFMQFLYPSFSFVPLSIGLQDFETANEIGEVLADHKSLLVASTDFSHVGLSYRQLPPRGASPHEWAQEQDKKAIDAIMSLDAKRFLDIVDEHAVSMCGYGVVAAVMIAAKKRGAQTVQLLSYATSYDVHPSESCVGYAAIVIK